ncbi:hypothetical protein P154DRAFT_444266, partial [Amniculicola lignicola CBS 123094]
ASVYIYNITIHQALDNISPFEYYFSKKPNYQYLKIWGSIIYYKDKSTSLTKLEPRAKIGILVGYTTYNTYKIYDIKSKRAILSRDCTILENTFYNFNNT